MASSGSSKRPKPLKSWWVFGGVDIFSWLCWFKSATKHPMFGKKTIITLPSIERCRAYVDHDVIHFAAILWEDRCEVIGVCALDYLRISSWPRARTVASPCHAVVNLPWKWCRTQPMHVLVPNSRCSSCGWLTGQVALDDYLCKECFNVGVCRSCHYLDASGKYRCVQCLPMFSK